MAYSSGRAWRALGSGLMGIGRIVAGKREREEQAARRAEDEAWKRALRDIELAERGGGRGPVPTRRVTFGELGRDLPTFTAPEGPLTGEPPSGPGLRMEPGDVVGREPLPMLEPAEIEEPDPRYREVGEGLGYVMTPEAREEEARERRLTGIGEAITAATDYSPERARRIAEGMEAGVPTSVLFPEEPEPRTLTVHGREVPDTPAGRDEALDWHRKYTEAGRSPRSTARGSIRVTVEGVTRYFPDTPRGREEATAWREEIAGEDWETPPGWEGFTRAQLMATLPLATQHYIETGVWDPTLDEQDGREEQAPPGPGWLERTKSALGFGKEEAAGDIPEPLNLPSGPMRHEPVPEPIGSGVGVERARPPRRRREIPEPRPVPGSDQDTTMAPRTERSLELETDIREALLEGQTAEEILGELQAVGAPDSIIDEAREILGALNGSGTEGTGGRLVGPESR